MLWCKMWKEWIDERLKLKWLSGGMKKSILEDYGETNQRWGRYRLAQIKSELSDVVDLAAGSQRGYMKPSQPALDAIHTAIDKGAFDSVSMRPGKLVEAREAIADKFTSLYGIEVDPKSEVTLTVGAAFVIDATLRILVDPGDEVLVMDPDYATYEAQTASYRAKIVPVPLKEEPLGKWRFYVDELEKRATPKTKLLMMSNANNPTSYLYTKEDNEAILEIAKKNDFFILSDQVSEEILFDGCKYHSIASLPGALNRTIVCSSLSKLYNLSGFRVGYAIANKQVIEQMNVITGWVTDNIVSLGADAVTAIFRNKEKTEQYVKNVLADLQKRRDYMIGRLSKMDGVIPNHPTGIYWAFPNVASFGVSSQQLAEFLMREGKVYVRPGTWYGRNGEGHFRLSFCVAWDWIREGMDRMERALEKFQ